MLQQAEFLKDIIEKSSRSKSTILRPLIWLIATFLSSAIGTFYVKAPTWVSIALLCIAVLVSFFFLGVYLYALIKSPDLLRTDEFGISKMVIEKAYIGTEKTGLIKLDSMDPPALSNNSSD